MHTVLLLLYFDRVQPNHLRKKDLLRTNWGLRSEWKTLSYVGGNPDRATHFLDNLSNTRECC